MPEECRIPRALSCALFQGRFFFPQCSWTGSPKAFSPCLPEPGKKKHSYRSLKICPEQWTLRAAELSQHCCQGWVLGWCWASPQLETQHPSWDWSSWTAALSLTAPKVSPAWGLSWGTPVAGGTDTADQTPALEQGLILIEALSCFSSPRRQMFILECNDNNKLDIRVFKGQ